MKSVLISIQPYWVFLIIAKAMGWDIEKEKTVEVRKSYPKNENWDKIAKIYCSKDKKSFAKIPKKYQPLMQRFLGKVIGEFVCDNIETLFDTNGNPVNYMTEILPDILKRTALTYKEFQVYTNGRATRNSIYGWHISDLVIYDKPKELSEFRKPCNYDLGCKCCSMYFPGTIYAEPYCKNGNLEIKRPPQSWCYV